MSIATELQRIKAAKTAITEAINAKGGTLTGDESLGVYADAIANLPSGGGGMDFFKCAAVHGPYKVTRIRVSGAGTTAVNGDYELTDLKSGSNEEVWKLIGGNYYLYKMNGYSFGIDTDYAKEPYQSLYYTEMHSENPDPTSGSWYTGYDYSTDTATGVTPVPTVTKFQVTMDEDVPKTWDGYKAVLTDGIYDFEKELTTGMSYGEAFTPGKGRVYDATCTVAVSRLYKGLPDGLIFYAPLESYTSEAETGQALTYKGSPEVTEKDGIPSVVFDGSSYISASAAQLPAGSSARTVSMWVKKGESYSDITVVSYGENSNNQRFSVGFSGDRLEVWGKNNTTSYDYTFEVSKWYHVAVTLNGTAEQLYINGELIAEATHTDLNTVLNELCIGAAAVEHIEKFIGNIAAVRVYDRVLTDAEIADLAEEFNITA